MKYKINKIQYYFKIFESTIIDLVSSATTWIAPMIPAYLTWYHLVKVLLFPEWIAFIGAIVVEFLGLSSITTTLQFVDYNRMKRKTDPSAPIYVPLFSTIFYFTIIVVVNILLDDTVLLIRLSKGLLVCLSIIAGLILSSRSQHAHRLINIQTEYEEKRNLRNASETQKTQSVINKRKVKQTPRTCEICGYKAINSWAYSAHMKKHKGNK